MSRLLNAIVAVCPDLGIGKNGELPWHPIRLNNEFKHFRKMTSTPSINDEWSQTRSCDVSPESTLDWRTPRLSAPQSLHPPGGGRQHLNLSSGKQNVVIMGRKTWFSIPEKNRPLANRINIVLSRQSKEPPAGAHHLARDLSSALQLVETELVEQADQVWVIGGSSLYQEVMERPGTRRLFVTRILKQFDCDTFLPEIKADAFRQLPQFPGVPRELQEENGIQYRYEVYESVEL